MKNKVLFVLTIIFSLSFYSCGDKTEEPTPYYPEELPPQDYELWGDYVYIVSGEMTMTAEGYYQKTDIKDLIHYDGIELMRRYYPDQADVLVYKKNGERDYSEDDVPYTLSNYNLMISPETDTETQDGITMHLTLNHGIATISSDKRTITWTTTISGLATADGVPPITISGSYTNKAVKE